MFPAQFAGGRVQRPDSPAARYCLARYFEELDYATIEQTLGLTNGALRGILGRALGVMRRKLKPALATIA
jgi:DNA-directed RNA polymerase specialized sigma24 family protein